MIRGEPRTQTLRLFVAVELPEEWKREIAAVQGRLRRQPLPHLRWVRPEGVHLTLKFLGNVQPDLAQAVDAALREHFPAPPDLSLTLEGLGTFGRGAPRVVWIGVGGDVTALAALQQRVELALTPLGFEPEGRAFSPHLTVARVPEAVPARERRAVLAALAGLPPPRAAPFRPAALSLMQSHLRPDGAVYTRRAAYPPLDAPEQAP